MIVTGAPDASLPATCGSEPIGLIPPFGGRQGTRLKMSPADFATSLTFSIALAVRLLGCCGPGWSTAVILAVPVIAVPVVCDADALTLSDLATPDSAACWTACWTTWARAGSINAGANSTHAATAGAASDAIPQKGRTKLINAWSLVLLGWFKMRGVDHKFRQRTREAIMDALGKFGAVRRTEQIEIS